MVLLPVNLTYWLCSQSQFHSIERDQTYKRYWKNIGHRLPSSIYMALQILPGEKKIGSVTQRAIVSAMISSSARLSLGTIQQGNGLGRLVRYDQFSLLLDHEGTNDEHALQPARYKNT